MVVINSGPPGPTGPKGDTGGTGATGPAGPNVTPFSQPGTLSVNNGTIPWIVPKSVSIIGWIIAVGTAPSGSSIIVDIIKNGTTVFTTQANRPTIPSGSTQSTIAVPDVTSYSVGDKVTINIVQVGSTTSGSDLGVSPVT